MRKSKQKKKEFLEITYPTNFEAFGVNAEEFLKILKNLPSSKRFLDCTLTNLYLEKERSSVLPLKAQDLPTRYWWDLYETDFDSKQFRTLNRFDPSTAKILTSYGWPIQQLKLILERNANVDPEDSTILKCSSKQFKTVTVAKAMYAKYILPTVGIKSHVKVSAYSAYKELDPTPVNNSQFHYLIRHYLHWLFQEASTVFMGSEFVRLRVITECVRLFPNPDECLKVLQRVTTPRFFQIIGPDDDLENRIKELANLNSPKTNR